jgi:LysM repeat protein
MSLSRNRQTRVRPLFAPLAIALLAVGLSGCYTRQIEGIQSDLDTLDRKLHSINNKGGAETASLSKKDFLRIEDQLNRVTLQQADMQDEIVRMQGEVGQLKTEGIPVAAGPGGSIPDSELQTLRREIGKNKEQTDKVNREMGELQKTFNNLRTETTALIQILRDEFGGGAVSSTAASAAAEEPEVQWDTKSTETPTADASEPAPNLSKSEPAMTVGKTYRVSPGENLTTIARKFGVTVETLKEMNGIDNPNKVRMGQVIYLP